MNFFMSLFFIHFISVPSRNWRIQDGGYWAIAATIQIFYLQMCMLIIIYSMYRWSIWNAILASDTFILHHQFSSRFQARLVRQSMMHTMESNFCKDEWCSYITSVSSRNLLDVLGLWWQWWDKLQQLAMVIASVACCLPKRGVACE